MYKEHCKDLVSLGFEKRNRDTRELLAGFIDEIDNDVGYFEALCIKANKLKHIANSLIDFKSLIRNHIGIMNGKYVKKDNETENSSNYKRLIEWQKRRSQEKDEKL
jgi:hypothetical protein